MTDNSDTLFHDQVVDKVEETLRVNFSGLELDGDVASVCRDFLSATTPIVFGNGTTEALLNVENLTPNDPSADAMSLRFDDPLEGRDGQIETMNIVLSVARVAISLIDDLDSLIAAHLRQRIKVIEDTLSEMHNFVTSGEMVQPRTWEQKTTLFAQSLLRRIQLAWKEGLLVKNFTTDPTYLKKKAAADADEGESTDLSGGRDKLHIRKGDISMFEVLETRNELEEKYSVNRDHASFPDLAMLEAQGKYEDHEQAYLFVQEKGAENPLPTYEVRIRKVTSSKGVEICYLTIKCGDGESRAETNCKIGEDLYDALLRLRQEEYSVIHKRRYLVSKDNTAETTIDKTLLADGTYDFSAEVEFSPDITEVPAGFVPPAWTTTERTGKEYKMRNFSRRGCTMPQE